MKIKLLITTLLLLTLTSPALVSGLELTMRSTLEVDESILKDDNLYANPEEILIVPINVSKEYNLNDADWYKGIYYYTVDRLGFADMPFHYLISESGNIYKGNKFGDEKHIALTNFGANTIIIGYINKSNNTAIDPRAENPLKELILQIANYNNINPKRTSVRNLYFKRNKDAKTVETIADKSFGNWENNIAKLIDGLNGFAPIQKEYSAKVLSVNTPTEELEPGQEVSVQISLKNTGQNGNYSDSNSEIILTKTTAGPSLYFINNVWSSQTQTPIMVSGQNFLPGQEQVFEFKIKAPLYVGQLVEAFELTTFSGSKIQSETIEIKINVKNTGKQIVAIKNNSAGFSNVYSQPYTSSNVALRAVSGERFFLIDQNNQTLWARIDLGNGQIGWIAIWNLSYL